MKTNTNDPDDIQIRRIFLRDDAERIQELQKDAPEFNQHYPRHFDWLRMAIDEVVEGKRFAFAIYKSTFASSGEATVALIGSIILKKEAYSHVMQLKNLFIKPEFRGKRYGQRFFSVVEQFCLKRGCTSIETEVPFDERRTVNFLNLSGFFVQNLMDSPYRRGDRVYRMYKPLPAKYTGDPFDLFGSSTWLFEQALGFRVVRSEINGKAEGRFFFETTSVADALQLRGLAYVWDSPDKLSGAAVRQLQKEKEFPLIAVVSRAFSPDALNECHKNRIRSFDQTTLYRERKSALDLPTFPREDVHGMIVTINSKYEHLVLGGDGRRTYFKGGPAGKYLKAGDSLFFYVEDSPVMLGGSIKGLATIATCSVGPPQEMWRKHEAENPLFPKNEYFTWSADKAEVIAITFSNVHEIESQALSFPVLKDILKSSGVFDSESLGHLYLSATDVELLVARGDKKLQRQKTLSRRLSSASQLASSYTAEKRQKKRGDVRR